MYLMKKTIAVVDDDQPIVDVMTLLLKDEGFSVKTYNNGEELLKDIEKANVNLILLDYRLPKLNGAEVAKVLKTHNKTKDIPVIMVSANHNLEDTLDRSSIDDFIAKPFDINNLIEKVYCHL